MRSRRKQRDPLNELVNEAVLGGIEYLRRTRGIDIETEQLSKNYLDKKRVKDEIRNYLSSKKFNLVPDEEKGQIIREHIIKYIVEKKPFNERGERLFGGSLEALVGEQKQSWWSKFFGKGNYEPVEKRAQEYLTNKEMAEELLEVIPKYPGLVHEYPKINEKMMAASLSASKGALADIYFSRGRMEKNLYSQIKQGASKAYEDIISYVGKGFKTPHAAAIFALAGFAIVLFSGEPAVTGAVIGRNIHFNLTNVIGASLVILSSLCFFGWRKKK